MNKNDFDFNQIKLNSSIIEGFHNTFVGEVLDERVDTPSVHREWWTYATTDKYKKIAIAAPRSHAKSTCMTVSFTLANLFFRTKKNILVVSASEEIALQFTTTLSNIIKNSEGLMLTFNGSTPLNFVKDTVGELVLEFKDGYQCRVVAKGAGQRVRGVQWGSVRPDLIIIDDLEDDKSVETKEQRDKLDNWIYKTLLPCGSIKCNIIWIGTILHYDSCLNRVMPKGENKTQTPLRTICKKPIGGWYSVKYKAHNEDFSHILWPERWNRELLTNKLEEYVELNKRDVYYQEYLNEPHDDKNSHVRKAWFHSMSEEDLDEKKTPKLYYAAADLAIGLKEKDDYSVFIVGGKCSDGLLHIVEIIRERLGPHEIIDTMIELQRRYKLQLFTIESEKIEKAIYPFLVERMFKENLIINLNRISPTKDKAARAVSIIARMKNGGVRFNKELENYQELENEMTGFPYRTHDDCFDSMAYLGLGLHKYSDSDTAEEIEKQEYIDEREERRELLANEQSFLFNYHDTGY